MEEKLKKRFVFYTTKDNQLLESVECMEEQRTKYDDLPQRN